MKMFEILELAINAKNEGRMDDYEAIKKTLEEIAHAERRKRVRENTRDAGRKPAS